MDYDTIIVGGGPAGLSAALVLGRCRRRILICDSQKYRNSWSHGVHGFLTRDGTPPAEVLEIGRKQLEPYGVAFRMCLVKGACQQDPGFKITLEDGTDLTCRKLLLATGVVDQIPKLEGIDSLYGRSVHHCPYCDAFEVSGQPLAVYGQGNKGFGLALSLKTWSEDVVLLSDGKARLTTPQREKLAQFKITIREEKIARLEGKDGILERIVFKTGAPLPRRAIFFNTGQYQRCSLAENFGCLFTDKGTVRTGKREETNIPGLFVVGDASRDVQFVVVAASEGAKAAQAINTELQEEDRQAYLGSLA